MRYVCDAVTKHLEAIDAARKQKALEIAEAKRAAKQKEKEAK